MFSPLFITGKNAIDVYNYGIHLCFAFFMTSFANHRSYFFSKCPGPNARKGKIVNNPSFSSIDNG